MISESKQPGVAGRTFIMLLPGISWVPVGRENPPSPHGSLVNTHIRVHTHTCGHTRVTAPIP